MGMVVSAAVTGVPIIEELERPYNTKNNKARAIVEPPPEVKSQHIPPTSSSSSSIKTVRKTYAATGASRKTSKISNFKGRTPPISTASSKTLTRKKIQK